MFRWDQSPHTAIRRDFEPSQWPQDNISSELRSRSKDATMHFDNLSEEKERKTKSQSPRSNTSSNRTKSSSSRGKYDKPGRDSPKLDRGHSSNSQRTSGSKRKDKTNPSLGSREAATSDSTPKVESIMKTREENTTSTPVPARPHSPKSRNCSRTRAFGYSQDDQIIPIVASPSVFRNSQDSPSDLRGASFAAEKRPMSRVNFRQRSHSLTGSLTSQYSTLNDRYSTPGDEHQIWRPQSRTISRGRQLASRQLLASHHKNQHFERASSADSSRSILLTIDLARPVSRGMSSENNNINPLLDSSTYQQASDSKGHGRPEEFERVESVLCPNCPVHGQSSTLDEEIQPASTNSSL